MSTLDQRIKTLGSRTIEIDFINLIDELKITNLKFNNKYLVDLLSERHPIYNDRGSITSRRMRGYLIATFQEIGTPAKALPYLLEELETSFYPYMVAASAKAIRGLKDPHHGIAEFLVKSIFNIWQGDSYVNYSSYKVPYKDENHKTTALTEIFTSIQWMGQKAKYVLPELHHLESHLREYLNHENLQRLNECIDHLEAFDAIEGDCCSIPMDVYNSKDMDNELQYTTVDLSSIVLEDQEGNRYKWNDFFQGKYTVLSFFYSRCHNPWKCIRTNYSSEGVEK